jgi:hypothetical protein
VVQFIGRWLLETEHLAAGGVDAAHDGPDRAVLAGCIHRLEHEQDRMTVARH